VTRIPRKDIPIRNLCEIDCKDNNYNSIALSSFIHRSLDTSVNPKRRQTKAALLFRKNQDWNGNKTLFYYDSTLTVGYESLSLHSKYDKALHCCSDRSSFCHDLEMKILIIPLSNCHSISSS